MIIYKVEKEKSKKDREVSKKDNKEDDKSRDRKKRKEKEDSVIDDGNSDIKSAKSKIKAGARVGEEIKLNYSQLQDAQNQNINDSDQQIPEEKRCYYHQLPLFFYCESCEEPICEQCTQLGPHNNQVKT